MNHNLHLPSSPPSGILLIDKPAKKTSFYLVSLLRRLTRVKKIGHCGTLDPFATGVMVMLVGKNYTRRSNEWMGMDKSYKATLQLGSATNTYDLDGQVTHTCESIPSQDDIDHALEAFQGEVQQIPPMFSAKKVGGKKLYDLARKGQEIERKPCTVNMHVKCISYSYPHLTLEVTCSKGTYIRSIAHDLGCALGCYAHLIELIRTQSGPFPLNKCLSIDDLLADNFQIHHHLLQL